MHPYLAEFIGTALLLLLGNGVVANVVLPQTKGHGAGWIVIAFGWGMAVFVAVWCVASASGAHINPAVSISLAAAGNLPWAELPGYIGAQFLGAMLGAWLVYFLYQDHYKVCDNADEILATFATSAAIRNPPINFFSEVVGTFVLVFAVLMASEPSLLVDGEASTKIGLGSLGALPVGLLVFSIGMSLGGLTGYAINPARDLGPRIVHAWLPIANKGASDWAYAPIPVLGPIVGGLLATLLHRVL